MSRRLNRSVLAGGVVYPAGTPEGDVKAKVADRFFGGESTAPAGETVEEVRAAAEKAIADLTAQLDEAKDAWAKSQEELAQALADLEQFRSAAGGDGPAGGDAPEVDYGDMSVADLKELIEKRNTGRDEGDLVVPDDKRSTASLVAALKADDEKTASAATQD